MRIGIQQSTINSTSLAKGFAIASKAQAEGIGISVPSMRAMIDLGRQDYAKDLRSLAHAYDLELVNLHLGCLSEDPSLIGQGREMSGGLAVVRMGLWVAAEAGIPTVIAPFQGRNRIEFLHEQRQAEKAIAELAGEAEQVGVTLAIETDLPSEQVRAMLGYAASDNVEIALNTGHIHAHRLELAGMVRELADRVDQVHAKDVVLAPRMAPEFNIRLGRGDVDFGTVIRTLRAIGFNGWINVDAPPGDDDGQIAAANIAFIHGLLNGLDWLATKLVRARAGVVAPAEELTPA